MEDQYAAMQSQLRQRGQFVPQERPYPNDYDMSPRRPTHGQLSWWNIVLSLLMGIVLLALLGMVIYLTVAVSQNYKKWRGKSCDGDVNISSAGNGNGNGPPSKDPPAGDGLCLDPSDNWPAYEFPTRDTDTLAATLCTDCRSESVPVCASGVCRAKLTQFDSSSPTVVADGADATRFVVTVRGYYRFQVVLSASTVCPVRKIEVALWDETNDVQIGESELVNSFAPTGLFRDRIVEAATTFSIRVISPSSSDRLAAYGRVLRSSLLDKLLQQTLFDSQTRVKWIPSRPGTLPPPGASPLFPGQYPNNSVSYPWLSPVLPAGVLTPPLPTLMAPLPPLTAVPDADGYSKFQSVPTSLDTYFQRDTFNAPPTDPALTLFLTALEDRGLDRYGRRNHRKTEYMAALTSERVLGYVPKIQGFVNRVYSSVATNDMPLLSAFKEELIEFFLDVHWGEDPERPEFVRQYFRLFIDIVGFGDPTLPGRNEAFLFGADNSQAVRDYARAQTVKVIAARDTTSIVYWWNLAGLSVEAQLTEAVHNIVAFSQFNHHLFLVMRDKLTGTPFPPPLPANIQYNFLTVYLSLPTDELKLNLIRETYRILLPNGNDFSRVKEATPGGETVSARHIRLPIQIAAQTVLAGGNPAAGAAGFLNLNLTQYGASPIGDDYNTNFTDNNCPALSEDSDHFYSEDLFSVSTIDGETLIDNCNPKMVPVFKVLKYYPFGAGYRRCAGESFNMIVTKLMFDRFAAMPVEQRAIPPGTPPVTLAPFVFAEDDIYFQKSLVVVP